MRRNGFTLIEVLVALAVLGIALATILRLGQGNLRIVESRERGAALTILAETVLDAARLGVEADLGTPALPMPPGVDWRIERPPLNVSDLDGLGAGGDGLGETVGRLVVRVEDAAGHAVGLDTLVPLDR